MLARLGKTCARHRWVVIGLWVVAVAGLTVLGGAIGGKAVNTLTIPGASSQEALDLLDDDFTQATDASAQVFFHTPEGTQVTDPDVEAQIVQANLAIEALDDVSLVVPIGGSGADAVVDDGRTTGLQVFYDTTQADLPESGITSFQDLDDAVDPFRSDTLQVELGGTLSNTQPTPTNDIYTLLGLALALVVLLVVLGTWTSFAWPVVGALSGVALGLPLLRILQDAASVPSIAATAGIMVGLGVGIDYGLFVVGRYKDYVAEGVETDEAIGRALANAGRAVLTAGSTVVVALGALFVFDLDAVTSMAYAVVIFVVCVILAAVTLVPAILSAVGPRILHARSPVALKVPEDDTTRLGVRWTRFIGRHAVLALLLGVGLLAALAIPTFDGSFRLGPLDASLYPTDSTQYKAWEIQTEAYGEGAPNPFLIVVQIPSSDTDATAQLTTLVSDLQAADGVASVTPPQVNDDGSLAVLQITPTTGAQDEATAELVDDLRDDTIPSAIEGTDLTVDVSGTNAVFVDVDARILDRLVLFIGLVVLIALVILGLVFRSVPIAVKAALLNLLVIGATYGVTILVFTEGVGLSLLGVPAEVPILSLLAPVIFAVLFGLSNDYEVYLVTRSREELERGEAPKDAAALGIGRGVHIVIAAALIMVFVFASYIFQPGTSVVQFGFAMTAAILLDALVARMVLLPAIMQLGGRRMWWPGRRHLEASSA